MDLHEVTPSHMAHSATIHVGRAEEEEIARLVNEPHAVLREAGLDVASGTPVRIEVSREETEDERRVGVGVIIIVIGGIIIIIIIIVVYAARTAQ
jgi:hypothetical protein